MTLLDTIKDHQAAYSRGLQEGIRIGKREQAASVNELVEALGAVLDNDYAGALDISSNDPSLVRARVVLAKHAPRETHDDKPDGRPDMHVTTSPSDLGADGKRILR